VLAGYFLLVLLATLWWGVWAGIAAMFGLPTLYLVASVAWVMIRDELMELASKRRHPAGSDWQGRTR
jgi:hypothetical protein